MAEATSTTITATKTTSAKVLAEATSTTTTATRTSLTKVLTEATSTTTATRTASTKVLTEATSTTTATRTASTKVLTEATSTTTTRDSIYNEDAAVEKATGTGPFYTVFRLLHNYVPFMLPVSLKHLLKQTAKWACSVFPVNVMISTWGLSCGVDSRW